MAFANKEKIKDIWLYLMLFSFFYELPIFYMTNMDRINPRLYDIMFIIGLFLFYREIISEKVENIIYKNWKYIVYWFLFCSIIWTIIDFPLEISAFSLLFALRYLQGLLVLKLLLIHPKLSFDVIGKVSFMGTVFISIYCLYEYNVGYVGGIYEIAPGKYLDVYADSVFGPLSPSYLHLGQLLPLSVIVSFAYILKNDLGRIWYIVLFAASWPIFFAGSRAGLFLFFMSIILFCFIYRNVIWKMLPLIAILIVLFLWSYNSIILNFENARTLNRFEELNDSDGTNSITARLSVFERFNIEEYDNGVLMPLIGAGFNAAPVNGNYRIDFGIHSMYLYPIEQSGLFGFFLFLLLLYRIIKLLFKEKEYSYYVGALLVYILAMLCVGFGNQNFWRGGSTGNLNTYIVLLACVACLFQNKRIRGEYD